MKIILRCLGHVVCARTKIVIAVVAEAAGVAGTAEAAGAAEAAKTAAAIAAASNTHKCSREAYQKSRQKGNRGPCPQLLPLLLTHIVSI
jgi:hypothetical protein